VALFASAAACTSSTQISSGADYLKRAETAGAVLDEEFKALASIEPILTFPARIGIARIEKGALTDIPQEELTRWAGAFDEDGNTYVPVNLFITDLVAPEGSATPDLASRRRSIIERLKLSGARQHMDAILVYEVRTASERRANGLALANLSIIGMFIAPGSEVSSSAVASGLLFDVRNGYPYAQLTVTADEREIAPLAYAGDRKIDVEARSITIAVENLSNEAADVMHSLKTELATTTGDS
jgi:hypothetical protein